MQVCVLVVFVSCALCAGPKRKTVNEHVPVQPAAEPGGALFVDQCLASVVDLLLMPC